MYAGLCRHAVTREVMRDVRRGPCRFLAAAVLGIDRHHRHFLGAGQKRQRIVERARHLARGIPGDQHVAADPLERSRIGDGEDRPAGVEQETLDKMRAAARGVLGIDLSDHRQIGIARVQHSGLGQGPLDDAPFRRQAGALAVVGEPRFDTAGLRLGRTAHVGSDQLQRLDLGFGAGVRHSANEQRYRRHEIEADEMRGVTAGEIDRHRDPRCDMVFVGEDDEHVLEWHDSLLSKRRRQLDRRLVAPKVPTRLDLGQHRLIWSRR